MKKWYKSKTLIFNGVAAIVGVSMALSDVDLPPNVLKTLGAIVTVGNIVLRFRTVEPIKTRKRGIEENIKEAKETAKDYVEQRIKEGKFRNDDYGNEAVNLKKKK